MPPRLRILNRFFPPQSFFLRYLGPALLPALLIFQSGCSAGGPPFRDAPTGEAAGINGVYGFSLPLRFYRRLTLGELFLETPDRQPRRTHFNLRFAGIDRTDSLRVRSYQGRAYRLGGFLELRSARCYIYGKRDWEERLVPLERWDCPHLFFQFESRDHFAPGGSFVGVGGDRTIYSDWLGKFNPVALPHPLPRTGDGNGREYRRRDFSRGDYFIGRLIHDFGDGRLVVWGHEAGRMTVVDQKLAVLDERGDIAAEITVVSRPGDFLVAQKKPGGPALSPGMQVFTRRHRRPGGLFD